jgi:excinuclease UvrABC nuclease subunit
MVEILKADLSALPSVPLDRLEDLPETPGVYLAVDSSLVVQYIGRTKNLRARWKFKSHHRYSQIATDPKSRVYWLCPANEALLPDLETLLIGRFKPILNNTKITGPKVRVSFEVEGWVKAKARVLADRDRRSLSNYVEQLIKKAVKEAFPDEVPF